MDPLLIIVLVLIILWATGAFIFPVGSIVHLLLVVILIVVLVRLLRGQSL